MFPRFAALGLTLSHSHDHFHLIYVKNNNKNDETIFHNFFFSFVISRTERKRVETRSMRVLRPRCEANRGENARREDSFGQKLSFNDSQKSFYVGTPEW